MRMEGRKVVVPCPDPRCRIGTYDLAHKRFESAATPVDGQPMNSAPGARLLGACPTSRPVLPLAARITEPPCRPQ